jgi:hypothetical protein
VAVVCPARTINISILYFPPSSFHDEQQIFDTQAPPRTPPEMKNFLENVEDTPIPLDRDIIASVPRENQQTSGWDAPKAKYRD